MAEERNVFQRMGNIWRRILRLLRLRAKTETFEASNLEISDKKLDRNLTYDYDVTLSELPHEYNKRLGGISKDLQFKGYEEGLTGRRTPEEKVEEIAKIKVEHVQAGLVTYAQRLYDKADSEYSTRKLKKKNIKSLYKSSRDYYFELIRQSQLFSRHYSFSLMIIYISCAILLVVSDIPLALELTKDGFGLGKTEEESLELVKLFDPLQDEKSSLNQFWDVIRANWEVALMSLGVALFTVYIKVFWDEFVGSPVQNTVRQYHQLPGKYDLFELEVIKRNGKQRFVIKFSVLVLTIATILVLGFFRVSTKIDAFEDRQKLAEQEGIVLPDSEKWSYLDGAAFILITLMFPLIGGICLSKGLSILHNKRQLFNSKHRYTTHRRQYLRFLSLEYGDAKSKLRELEILLNNCKSSEFFEKYAKDMVESYRLGLNQGIKESLMKANGDTFLTAKIFREQKTYQRIQQSLDRK
ncbi:MAG: hypothetical protein SF052_20505 [Bacteroidia bacterium]|nr:hypothetical protein [Bacteroidia bacterium]